jgi:hypothetical protein
LIKDDAFDKLVCIKLQKKCLNDIFSKIICEVTFEDFDLKTDFSMKIDVVFPLLKEATAKLNSMLPTKFYHNFSKSLVDYYILSFFLSKKDIGLDEDLGYFQELFSIMNEEVATLAFRAAQGLKQLLKEGDDQIILNQDQITKIL